MALTTGEDDVTSLYLLDGEGRIFRYGTALYPPAVRSVCEGFLANGGVFSYETGYVALAPYTVLAQEVAAPAVLSSERPPTTCFPPWASTPTPSPATPRAVERR